MLEFNDRSMNDLPAGHASFSKRRRVPTPNSPPNSCGFGRIGVVHHQISHLFVYGTLQPGDVRWHFLEPFVVDEGWADSVHGRVYDTGLGYPAAIVDDRIAPGGTIIGRTYPLLAASLSECLDILDAEEGTVDGDYRRVICSTERGVRAYMYEYGADLDAADLTEIPSGNWMAQSQ